MTKHDKFSLALATGIGQGLTEMGEHMMHAAHHSGGSHLFALAFMGLLWFVWMKES